MKNLKIKGKLFLSFSVIILLLVVVGAIAMVGIISLDRASTEMYENNVLGIQKLGLIKENYASQRAAYRNWLIFDGQSEDFQAAVNSVAALETEMDALLSDKGSEISDAAEMQVMADFVTAYRGGFKQMKEQLLVMGRENRTEEAIELLTSDPIQTLSASIVIAMESASQINSEHALEAVNANSAMANRNIVILLCAFAVACLLSVLLTKYLSGAIAKPLLSMTDYMKIVSTTGDMTMRRSDEENLAHCATLSDEIGVCVTATSEVVARVLEIGKALEAVAAGDLTGELALLSEHDTMGLYLKTMIQKLNEMFGEINNATSQVSIGSLQVSNGSQTLAQGTTQQASAVEELSTSIAGIAEKTKENAVRADEASNLAEEIKRNAQKGSGQMDQMLEAVKEIQEASSSIGKVIKVIDDIAFQTNILALNAAVEAARAGMHGKGFAVVAEEVRSLAAKSAEAAKDTESLIANSMEKSELGARIAGETAISLADIVVGINESGRIVSDIAISSGEQSVAIGQINNGIDQVAQVVQQNSATAQQSAAAAEEMSEQAHVLEDLVTRFKLKGDGKASAASRNIALPRKAPPLPVDKY